MAAAHSVRVVLRRAVGLSLVCGLLLAAAAFYTMASSLPRSAPPTQAPSPATTGSPTGPGTVAPVDAPPSTAPPPVPPTPAPTEGQPSLPPGPGTTETGILLVATPASDGTFDVSELVLLPTGTSSLAIAPPDAARAGRTFRVVEPMVTALQISAAGQPVLVPKARIDAPLRVGLGGSVTRIEMRYQLGGVAVRSTPSQAGRALAALGPLTEASAGDLPVAIRVNGPAVLNIECPQLRLSERACAAGKAPTMRVNRMLPLSDAVVVVQLDLPRPQ